MISATRGEEFHQLDGGSDPWCAVGLDQAEDEEDHHCQTAQGDSNIVSDHEPAERSPETEKDGLGLFLVLYSGAFRREFSGGGS